MKVNQYENSLEFKLDVRPTRPSTVSILELCEKTGTTMRLLAEAFHTEHGQTCIDNLRSSQPLFVMNVSLAEHGAIQNFQGHARC